MNLRYDALPGEWLDDEPIIDERWPDEPDTTDREEQRSMTTRACCICGATTHLEPAGEQTHGRRTVQTYGCIDFRACERRFEALLAKTQTTRTAQPASTTVQAA